MLSTGTASVPTTSAGGRLGAVWIGAPSALVKTEGERIAMFRQTWVAWRDHEGPRWGAALAFYTLLSLAPLVMLTFAAASLVFEHHSGRESLITRIHAVIGPSATQDLSEIIHHSVRPARGFPALAGIVTLVYGASGVFAELRAALNRMWDAIPDAGTGVWETIRAFFASVGMILGVGVCFRYFLR